MIKTFFVPSFMAAKTETVQEVEESATLLKEALDQMINWLIGKAGSVAIAIVFILIGLKVVGVFLKILKRSFEKSKMDPSVSGFLLSIIRMLGYVLVFITAAAIVGIEVTSFVTILGTASLAIGLALQGALSNLAGGVLILLLKPFQVGDYIIENNKNNEGTVVSIDIFIDSFDDSGMTLGIRVWVLTNDFWPVTWSLREAVKNAFDENGIEIPYNRLEVDIKK